MWYFALSGFSATFSSKDPAVNGTLNVMRAVQNHGPSVRRIVLTSSVAAICDEPEKVQLMDNFFELFPLQGVVLTEEVWNTKSSLTRNPYYYSKVSRNSFIRPIFLCFAIHIAVRMRIRILVAQTLAEQAAWDFMRSEARPFDLVVINPFVVMVLLLLHRVFFRVANCVKGRVGLGLT